VHVRLVHLDLRQQHLMKRNLVRKHTARQNHTLISSNKE
jgi:hypothetical protein